VFQAFYTKFYIPEKDLYPQEVECTDKLSRALVVRKRIILRIRKQGAAKMQHIKEAYKR